MSKLIVEMNMPTGCSWVEKGIEKRCPMAGIDHYLQIRCRVQSGRIVHTINKSGGVDRPSWCPIKGVLTDEHGDLIDRDIMYKEIELWKSTVTDTTTMCFLYHIEKLLMCIRPAIAAERKDDEQIH